MKKIDLIIIDCISYTAVMLIISILNGMGITELNWMFNLQLFTVTTLISVFMYFIDKLNIESQPVYMLLQMLSIAVSVLGVGGGIMKWFTWEFKYVAITSGIFITVYLITYVALFLINSITSEQINKKIAENDKKGGR
ncbi:hypothetical protein [Intestinibacter sp.]|uniref:hypothetical protein n=1 Tax=Intestinibacter sp. TaxID=1965304 RepID=UPI003F188FE1